MTLISKASQFWKMWSVQLMALVFLVAGLNEYWDAYQQYIPDPYHTYLQMILVVASAIARVIKQNGLSNDYTK